MADDIVEQDAKTGCWNFGKYNVSISKFEDDKKFVDDMHKSVVACKNADKNERVRERYHERKAKGLCVVCGKRAAVLNGEKLCYCPTHRDRQNEYQRDAWARK